jgi:four helix bundle protein
MRAAGSIGANLAEGYSRATRVDRLGFSAMR